MSCLRKQKENFFQRIWRECELHTIDVRLNFFFFFFIKERVFFCFLKEIHFYSLNMMYIRVLLLFTIVKQSSAQNIRTLRLSKMINIKYQCLSPGCSPSTLVSVSTLIRCQIACLSDANCRTVTFDKSDNYCELFPDIPSQYGNMSVQADVVTMVAIDGRQLSARK